MAKLSLFFGREFSDVDVADCPSSNERGRSGFPWGFSVLFEGSHLSNIPGKTWKFTIWLVRTGLLANCSVVKYRRSGVSDIGCWMITATHLQLQINQKGVHIKEERVLSEEQRCSGAEWLFEEALTKPSPTTTATLIWGKASWNLYKNLLLFW